MRALYFILLLSINLSCKPKCDCYSNKSQLAFRNLISVPFRVNEIKTDSLALLLKNEKHDPIFGFHLSINNGENLFSFLSKEKELIEFDIERGIEKNRMSLKNILSFRGYYTVLLKNDTLHFLDQHKNIYYQYKKLYGAPLQLIDSFNFGKVKSFNNCNINLIVGRPGLTYKWPFIWVQYGHLKKKNYIDSKAYFQINLIDKSLEKIIDYPYCYHCSYQYLPTSSLVILDNNSTACLFDYYDQIFVHQPNATKNKSFDLVHKCEMSIYDESKEHNLAYTRKYLENHEVNLGLLNISNGNLVAIKRLAKSSLADKPSYSIFVFDQHYKQLYTTEIPYNLGKIPVFFNYKEGFILFNDSLNKAYYYDFSK